MRAALGSRKKRFRKLAQVLTTLLRVLLDIGQDKINNVDVMFRS